MADERQRGSHQSRVGCISVYLKAFPLTQRTDPLPLVWNFPNRIEENADQRESSS